MYIHDDPEAWDKWQTRKCVSDAIYRAQHLNYSIFLNQNENLKIPHLQQSWQLSDKAFRAQQNVNPIIDPSFSEAVLKRMLDLLYRRKFQGF